MKGGESFGRNLSENQNQKSNNTGTDTHCRIAEQTHGNGRGQRGGCDVYDIVSD